MSEMMTMRDVAIIERIIRQAWYDSTDADEARFGTWLDVDQDQALALLAMIPNRFNCGPIKPLFSEQYSS